MTRISVIIPVYNAQNFLKDCIRSVQKQKLKEIEIICVDDGSTDNSLQVLQEMQLTDCRIYIFHQKNQGAGSARNYALKKASGEYICFLDADDLLMGDWALEKIYYAAVEHNAMICGGQFCIKKNKEIFYKNIYGNLCQNQTGGNFIRYTDYQYDFHYQNYIYSKSMIIENQIEFPNYRRYQDPPFFVKSMIAAKEFYVVNVPFYCYRIGHQNNILSNEKMNDWMRGLMEVLSISIQYSLKKLHRIIVYRINEICSKQFVNNIIKGNLSLAGLLIQANDMVKWEWVEENCRIEEKMLKPLTCILYGARIGIDEYYSKKKYKWTFPYRNLEEGALIALYGAGEVGNCYYEQLIKDNKFHLCIWVDGNYQKNGRVDRIVVSPVKLKDIYFDYVIIAVADMCKALDIMEYLSKIGIPNKKIIWSIEMN